jgi:hypothetical protein
MKKVTYLEPTHICQRRKEFRYIFSKSVIYNTYPVLYIVCDLFWARISAIGNTTGMCHLKNLQNLSATDGDLAHGIYAPLL